MNERAPNERGLDIDRLVYFSDAVFAIAMTVLVLSIHLPSVPGQKLGHVLRRLVPSIWSYFLSFAVIGLFWLAHHRMFHYVRRIDPATLRLNLVLLSLVAILPFPTEVLGTYGNHPLGTMVYASAATLVGGSYALLWWHVSRTPGVLRPDTPPEYVIHSQLRSLTIPIVFAASIPVALWSPDVAKFVWILAIPLRLALVRRYGRVYPEAPTR